MRRLKFPSKASGIDPQDFRDLRICSGMTRRQAAEALDVTPRTIQNWENSGARIPWMAYRMLRILRGHALPGTAWEGWTVRGGKLFNPAGRSFDAVWLSNVEYVFAQARLWRQMYASTGRDGPPLTAGKLLPTSTGGGLPDRRDDRSAKPQKQPKGFAVWRSVDNRKSACST